MGSQASVDPDPERCPIICNPYSEPDKHWDIDQNGRAVANIISGRRESSPGLVMVPGDRPPNLDSDNTHERINRTRRLVSQWRKGGWRGATSATKTLLAHWCDGEEQRPYWAQLEAIETLVWAFEVAPETDEGREIMEDVAKFNAVHSNGIPRLASKMATGTGKTVVMAMIIAWQACNAGVDPDRYASQFVVISPTTTIRERLAELDPGTGANVYDRMALLPPMMKSRVKVATVEIRTYQAFQKRNVLSRLGARALERRVLVGSKTDVPEEDTSAMLGRVLGGMIDFSSPFVVINDEAHHCYKPGTARRRGVSNEDHERAALWFKAILGMKNGGNGLLRVHDLSATPRFIERGDASTDSLFPWTVSDFPLTDAIESGLVKIPRVPVSGGMMTGDMCRNVFDNTPDSERNLDVDALPSSVDDPLRALYRSYASVFEEWSGAGWEIPPVFIIVANTIENAEALAAHVAGHEVAGSWVPGKFDLLSNDPNHPPRTIVVHSDLKEDDIPDKVTDLVRDDSVFTSVSNPSNKRTALRRILDTVGKIGRPGRGVRCVVSVSMLTEGWDAKNVTHVFGFRKFGTQLLCEQVAGRALRRQDTESGGWYETPSYAEIFGVPFDYMLNIDNPAPPAPPGIPVTADPSPDPGLAIEFPMVSRYDWVRSADAEVSLNESKVERYDVKSEMLEGTTGKSGRIVPSEYDDPDSVATFLAGAVVKKLTSGMDADRVSLYYQLVPIVHRWLDLATPNIGSEIAWLCAGSNTDKVAEKIRLACDVRVPDSREAVVPRPRVDLVESTLDKPYVTTVPDAERVCADQAKCSHTKAAFHSGLEARVAKNLDAHPRVTAWVRNHPKIGWTIPYYYEYGWRMYQPDFVARLKARGRSIFCLVEAKGVDDDASRAKAHFADKLWIPAINAERTYGEWAFVQVGHEDEVISALDDVIGSCNER